MDYLPIVLTTALVILTLMLMIVGIVVIQTLLKLKRTLNRINETIDMAEEKFNTVTSPLRQLGGMAISLGTGLKIFESFVGWLNRDKQE